MTNSLVFKERQISFSVNTLSIRNIELLKLLLKCFYLCHVGDSIGVLSVILCETINGKKIPDGL